MKSVKIYATFGIIIGLAIIALSVPINKNIDVVANVDISYPLIWDNPQIVDVTTEVTAHTLYHLPSLSPAGIISMSNVKLQIIGSGKSATKTIGTIYRSQDITSTIVLPDVSPTTNKVIIQLYSSSTLLDSKEVMLT